jgi:hypothetical protein
MKKTHPRFLYYPQHEEYYKMYPVYRPFVYWVNEPMFSSSFVNTDINGLRNNYLSDGTLIDLKSLKNRFDCCDVIVGGSTVFGVDASSDKQTISYHLSEDNVPCINLGNRGATSFQELNLFIVNQVFLPKIRNIYILSGVNNCSLASLDGSIIYDEYGGVFGQDYYMSQTYMSNLSVCYDDLSYNRFRLYNAIERRYRDYRLFRTFLRFLLSKAFKSEPIKNALADKRKGFDKKVEQLDANLDNELKVWRALADKHDANIHYFLQPCMFWNNKLLSKLEIECFNEDLKQFPTMEHYANKEFHLRYSEAIRGITKHNNIPFYDSNEVFDSIEKDITVFTDVCHLTDIGNKLVADFISKKTKK